MTPGVVGLVVFVSLALTGSVALWLFWRAVSRLPVSRAVELARALSDAERRAAFRRGGRVERSAVLKLLKDLRHGTADAGRSDAIKRTIDLIELGQHNNLS